MKTKLMKVFSRYFVMALCFLSLNICAQNITTFGGTGSAGFGGDGGQATSAQLNFPYGVATDQAGNVYIADNLNHRIRKISTSGIITTIAGTGIAGFSGDGGPGTSAQINYPVGIAVDAAGNVYFADRLNYRIRKINTMGIISTYAGTGAVGFSGDGGPATSAQIGVVAGISMDPSTGDLYLADQGNGRVRKISSTGIMSTFAGIGGAGYSGDGGPATSAQFNFVFGVTADGANNLYVCDINNYRVRKINSAGIITTFAGNGTVGSSGDGGAATSAQINYVTAVCLDPVGNVYLAEYSGHRVRKVSASGIITTIAGTGVGGYNGDNIPATTALLNEPHIVAMDASGGLYIGDRSNSRIRKISCTPPAITAFSSASMSCAGQTVSLSANGGVNYTWTPGGTGSNIVVSPTASTTYTVVGSNTLGCSGSATVSQMVGPTPNINASTSHPIICNGNTGTLTVTGAATYTWMPGNLTGSSVVVSPSVTTNYTVTGTNSVGCTTHTILTQYASPCTGMQNLTANNAGLIVYPNPSTGEFFLSANKELELFVMNDLGQVVKTIVLSEKNAYKAEVSDLSNGIYFIRTADGEFKQRLVILK